MALHPVGPGLPVQHRDTAALVPLTEEEVHAAVENLPRLSASACSGWTYDLIREIASTEVVSVATALLSRAASGTLEY